MDEHQMRRVVDWFRERAGDVTCSVCGRGEFKFDARLATIPLYGEPDGIPAVVRYCTNCAGTRLFAADKIGVTPYVGVSATVVAADTEPLALVHVGAA